MDKSRIARVIYVVFFTIFLRARAHAKNSYREKQTGKIRSLSRCTGHARSFQAMHEKSFCSMALCAFVIRESMEHIYLL